jgi:release factor glutamine methyltransferase
MTIAELQKEFLTTGRKRIAPEDFFILLAHTLKKDKVFLFAHPEYTISAANEARARSFFSRRTHCEPIALILGHKEFYGRDFAITKDTLIPRPETEILVDLALEEIRKYKTAGVKKIALVDVGTGSGNIIITLAKETKKTLRLPDIRYYAMDISAPALAIAKKNARQHRVNNIIKFHKGNLLDPYLPHTETKRSTIIAANLPYLAPYIEIP